MNRCELPCQYRFSLRERIAGLKYLLRRHPGTPVRRVYGEGGLERVLVGDFSLYVPRRLFKPFELPMIYHEVTGEGIFNPHAYFTPFVRIRPGDHVVDAGACEGFFSIQSLRCGAGKVYAFEPIPSLCEGLRRTFGGTGAMVEVLGKGLSDKKGLERMAPEEDEGTISSCRFDERGDMVVETLTLDGFVESHACDRIDFIKADVEGAEVRCIAGAIDTIRRFRPRMSIAIYHDYRNGQSIKEMIMDNVPEYNVTFGGCYMAERPFRPFMLYAWI